MEYDAHDCKTDMVGLELLLSTSASWSTVKGIVSSKMSYNFYWPDQICIFLENFL